jgi:hypothetical protein
VKLDYEKMIFGPRDLLEITGLPERTHQVWIARGFAPRAPRPGRGVERAWSLADALHLTFLKTTSDAGITLGEAALAALTVFPGLRTMLDPAVADIIDGADLQVFAVFNGGPLPVIAKRDEAIRICENAGAATLINLARLIQNTAAAARTAMERPEAQ